MDHSSTDHLKEIQETDPSSMDQSQHSMSDSYAAMGSVHDSGMSHDMMGMSVSKMHLISSNFEYNAIQLLSNKPRCKRTNFL